MELSDISAENVPLDEMPEMEGLNDRQRNFAVFYVSNGGNGAAAARSAGYSAKTAARTGGHMARNPKIRAAVLAVRGWFWKQHTMDKSEALYILSEIARANMGDYVDHGGEVSAAAIRRRGRAVEAYDPEKQTIRIRDPRAAIDTLGKLLGWGNELKVQAENVQIIIDNPEE